MEEQLFFEYYIPALEVALLNENTNYGYLVYGPDWYIESKEIRDKVDLFEQNNYEQHKVFFDLVALYFDAKSHNFREIEGVSVGDYKLRLNNIIEQYKKNFNL